MEWQGEDNVTDTISCTSFCCVFHERAVCPMQRKKDINQHCTPSNPNKGPSRNDGLIELFIYLLFAFKNAVWLSRERGQEVKFDGETALTHSVEKKQKKKRKKFTSFFKKIY